MNSVRDILLDQLPRIKNLAYEYFSIKGHRGVLRASYYDEPRVLFTRDPETGKGELHLILEVNQEKVDELDFEVWMDISTECRMLIDATFPGYDLIKIGNA